MTRLSGRRLDTVLVGIVLVAAWQAVSMTWGEYWASSPLGAATSLARLVASGELMRHAGYTLQETAYGLLIGLPPGIALPFLLRRHARVRAILAPFLIAAYGLPKLALAPLFLVWFGIGIESKVALVVSVAFFILFFNTTAGVRAVDAKLVTMARVLGATERSILKDVIWPGAAPYIFAGLRAALPYAIGGAVVTELISSNRGLGYLIQLSANRFNTNDVFAALIGVLVIVVACNWAVAAFERRALRWRPPAFATEGAG